MAVGVTRVLNNRSDSAMRARILLGLITGAGFNANTGTMTGLVTGDATATGCAGAALVIGVVPEELPVTGCCVEVVNGATTTGSLTTGFCSCGAGAFET